MKAALDAEPGVILFLQYVDAYHLGYQVDVSGDVVLPGYRGPVDVHAARTADPSP
jgi:uncharacterized protein YlxW (UPF0749 family)